MLLLILHRVPEIFFFKGELKEDEVLSKMSKGNVSWKTAIIGLKQSLVYRVNNALRNFSSSLF